MKVPNKTGSTDKKEVILEDHDPIWLELRHAHIADVSLMISYLDTLLIYPFYLFLRDGGELSTRDLQKMVQALPQYTEQIDKLSLHVEVVSVS
ncbi:hypothetical protein GW17_00005761 [Ensete ventricosum]|nr:hypothetical protein GW17_00005761 [Ensete ventricosum]